MKIYGIVRNAKKKTEGKRKRIKDIFLSRKCEVPYKCEEEGHEENNNELYCDDCKQYFCSECKDQHSQEHKNIVELQKINAKFIYEEYLNKLNEENSDIENEKFKNKLIACLNEQIELIKKAFEENKKINDNIKLLIKNILYTFESVSGTKKKITNYHVTSNIIFNCNFNKPYEHFKFNPVETSLSNINKLITYYKTNFIFGKNEISLNEFYKVKNIEQPNQSQVTGISPLSNGNIIFFFDEGLYGLGNDEFTDDKLYAINEGNNDLKYTTAVLELDKNYLVTGKLNCVITIWKVAYKDNKINLEKVREDPPQEKAEIKSFVSISNNSFAGFSESQIMIYSYQKEENGDLKVDSITIQLITFEDIGGKALTALIKPKDLEHVIMCGTNGSYIFIWDIENKEHRDFEGNKILCSKNALIEVDNNIICVACENEIVLLDYKNWKTKKEIIIKKRIENKKYIYIVPTRLNNVLLLGCSEDCSICLLDLNKEEISSGENNKLIQKWNLLVNWGKRSFLLSEGEGNISIWNY